jgi:hypothetical protein
MPHFSQTLEAWHSFLRELDGEATEETRLDCMGGFVANQTRHKPNHKDLPR